PKPQTLAGLRSRRTLPNLVNRTRFGGRQAIRGIARRPGADEGLRVVVASARVLDNSVRNAIEGIAGSDGRCLNRIEFSDGNGSAHFLIHRDLAPLPRGDEPIPIESRRPGKNPIEVVRIFLCLLVPLSAASRAPIPVGEFGAHAIVHMNELL